MSQLQAQSGAFLGQPRGLSTLFFTEMWERFTYYGMRSLLILYLVATVSQGGLGFDDKTASAIYGLYICGTYVFALAGGWVADRLIGPQRAVIAGAAFIVVGNALLTLGRMNVFFCGLLIIVLGVGLLKPNISAMVGQLYPEGGARRDAGFSIFYMGINVGALLGAILVPLFATRFGWRVAFSLGAVAMAIGLCAFLALRGQLPPTETATTARGARRSWAVVGAFLASIALVAALSMSGEIRLDPQAMSSAATWLMGLFAVGYFAYLLNGAGLSSAERKRVYVMIVLFVAYAVFYAGFEQGGASLNLFAERYTNRKIFGATMPAGILQGVTSLYTILLAPVFAWVWIALGKRGKDLSPLTKFAIGLGLLGLSALIMVAASRIVMTGHKVLPTWLLATYLLQECGDLCLSPVGLSSMTKLAPRRVVGQVMGVWFLALALGNNLAGQLSGEYDAANLASLPALFLQIMAFSLVAAVVLGLLSPRLSRLMKGAT
jgi:POT family proton-dependent oligopeptide transporter